MNSLISNKSELREIKQEASLLLKEVMNTLMELSAFVYARFANWIKKVGEDYTLENLKKEGLIEILCRRASLFFGISEEKREKAQAKRKKISRKIFRKVVLLPLYLLITLIHLLINYRSNAKKSKKVNKKVNSYETQ